MTAANQGNALLTHSAKIINFEVSKQREVRQSYSHQLQKVREMNIEDAIQELAAYKTAEALQVPYSLIEDVCL